MLQLRCFYILITICFAVIKGLFLFFVNLFVCFCLLLFFGGVFWGVLGGEFFGGFSLLLFVFISKKSNNILILS